MTPVSRPARWLNATVPHRVMDAVSGQTKLVAAPVWVHPGSRLPTVCQPQSAAPDAAMPRRLAPRPRARSGELRRGVRAVTMSSSTTVATWVIRRGGCGRPGGVRRHRIYLGCRWIRGRSVRCSRLRTAVDSGRACSPRLRGRRTDGCARTGPRWMRIATTIGGRRWTRCTFRSSSTGCGRTFAGPPATGSSTSPP